MIESYDGEEKRESYTFSPNLFKSLRKKLPYGTENMKCFFMSAKPMWALPWGSALELYHGVLFHGPGVNLGAKGRFGIEPPDFQARRCGFLLENSPVFQYRTLVIITAS